MINHGLMEPCRSIKICFVRLKGKMFDIFHKHIDTTLYKCRKKKDFLAYVQKVLPQKTTTLKLGPGRLCRHNNKHNRQPKASGIMPA